MAIFLHILSVISAPGVLFAFCVVLSIVALIVYWNKTKKVEGPKLQTESKLWKPDGEDIKKPFAKKAKTSKIAMERNQHSRRNRGLAGIMSLVIKADGRRTLDEINKVVDYVIAHYKYEDYSEIVKALKVNLKINNPNFVQMSCQWLTEDMVYCELLGTMECLFDVAMVNHGIDPGEWNLLFEVMQIFELEQEDIDYLSRKYAPFYRATQTDSSAGNADSTGLSVTMRCEDNSRENALRVLGLDEKATSADIQSAYRRLAKKYHPDTTQDDYMKAVLDEKFKEINDAYSRLK